MLPVSVGASDPEIEHGLYICFAPPRPGEFEPLLDDVPMSAFDLPRSDRTLSRHGGGVVELLPALTEVAVGLGDALVGSGTLGPMDGQGLDHLLGAIVEQPTLLGA